MLNRIALRLATVRALRGRTLVGDAVRDSEIGPIEDIAVDKPTPFLVVYTDDGHYHVGNRDLLAVSGDGRVETGWLSLVIEIAITQRMQHKSDVDIIQPTTDAAAEFNVDLIERQVLAALSDTRDGAVWPEMWRRFATSIGDRETRRGTLNRDGVRFAGRQIVLQVKLPHDPPVGTVAADNKLWSDFLALCLADAELAPLVPILTDAVAGIEMTTFERARGAFDLSRSEAWAMGLADASNGGISP